MTQPDGKPYGPREFIWLAVINLGTVLLVLLAAALGVLLAAALGVLLAAALGLWGAA